MLGRESLTMPLRNLRISNQGKESGEWYTLTISRIRLTYICITNGPITAMVDCSATMERVLSFQTLVDYNNKTEQRTSI
jgi:hypothetical protein